MIDTSKLSDLFK